MLNSCNPYLWNLSWLLCQIPNDKWRYNCSNNKQQTKKKSTTLHNTSDLSGNRTTFPSNMCQNGNFIFILHNQNNKGPNNLVISSFNDKHLTSNQQCQQSLLQKIISHLTWFNFKLLWDLLLFVKVIARHCYANI